MSSKEAWRKKKKPFKTIIVAWQMLATTLEHITPPAMQATMLPTPASVSLSIMVCSVSSKQHVWTPSNPCNKENNVWTTLLHHYSLLKSVMAKRHLVYRCSFSSVNFLCKENCPGIMLEMPESKCLKQGRKIQVAISFRFVPDLLRRWYRFSK